MGLADRDKRAVDRALNAQKRSNYLTNLKT
jgi:hypothetical protein